LFGSDVEKPVPNADPGIVDQHIDAIHEPDRFGERSFHLHEISNVCDDCLAQPWQLMLNARTGCPITIEHAHPRTFLQKACSSRRTNARCPASNQNSFVFQSTHGISSANVGTDAGHPMFLRPADRSEACSTKPQKL